MKRLAPVVFLLAAFALACGSAEEKAPPAGGAGGSGGEGGSGGVGIAPPTFEGVDEVKTSGLDTAHIFWKLADDVETPAAELTYQILVWQNEPTDGAAPDDTYDFGGNPETACSTRCRYNYSALAQDGVKWFAVEVTDADGMKAGRDKVLPAAVAGVPVIDRINPDTADVAGIVTIQGNHFLDERTSLDGLMLNGEPVDTEFVQSWDNRAIRLLVPASHGTGALELKVNTLGGSATATLTVNP